MQNLAEKLKFYVRIKWGTIAFIAFLVVIFALFGIITLFAAGVVLFALSFTALVNLWLILEIRRRKHLLLAAHGSLTLDILAITISLYFSGGMENTWLFCPVIIVYAAGYIFSLRSSLVYAALSFSIISAMFFFEYYKFIPHFSAYGLPEFYWRYPQYGIDYLAGMFVLYFVAAFASGGFNQLMEQRAKRIEEYSQELEKSRAEALSAEKKSRQAKAELETKVTELEKFQKVAVDRELKMIELKDEIERLKRHA